MTLDQIRYFASAAELLHIGRAAAREHISQPSLSIAIKKLEQELGVPLFAPNGRGIELTQQGKEFFPYAQNILRQVDQATEQMKGAKDRLNREIHMAYTAPLAFGYIPRLFKDFLASNKRDYRIYSDEMPTHVIAEGLRSGRYDFGICSQITPDPELVQQELMYHPFVVLAPKGMLDPNRITPEELCSKPFVSYLPEFPMYKQVMAVFEKLSQTPQISHYAYSEDAIARLVEQGLGVSIVAETDSMCLSDIDFFRPEWLTEGRYTYLTYPKNHFRGKAAKEMMHYIVRRSMTPSATIGRSQDAPVICQDS